MARIGRREKGPANNGFLEKERLIMAINIALAGNPNCGKTTMFNDLTGANQYVGNWPGVTVEKKEGRYRADKGVVVTDLPGVYSLSPYTPEEIVTRDYLMSGKPDAVINLVDATNLERNLYLTTQIIDLGIPVVVALNMMDLVEKNGDKIDVNSLLNSGTRIDDVVTFVVGAVDEDETRTDALMVVTMDTNKKTINVMNIPRDTMCNNSATGASRKINAAYAIGGIEQTKKEIERLLGFRPDYYVIVNFDGIAAIVDAIGGVEYEVPFRMEYDDPSQDLHIDLYAGNQTLNGDQVVQFLRWRHNNDYSVQYPNGDEGRVENQQKFLKELANQVFQLFNIVVCCLGCRDKALDVIYICNQTTLDCLFYFYL